MDSGDNDYNGMVNEDAWVKCSEEVREDNEELHCDL